MRTRANVVVLAILVAGCGSGGAVDGPTGTPSSRASGSIEPTAATVVSLPSIAPVPSETPRPTATPAAPTSLASGTPSSGAAPTRRPIPSLLPQTSNLGYRIALPSDWQQSGQSEDGEEYAGPEDQDLWVTVRTVTRGTTLETVVDQVVRAAEADGFAEDSVSAGRLDGAPATVLTLHSEEASTWEIVGLSGRTLGVVRLDAPAGDGDVDNGALFTLIAASFRFPGR